MIKYLRIAILAFLIAYFAHLTVAHAAGKHRAPLPAPSASVAPDPSPVPVATLTPTPSAPMRIMVGNIVGATGDEVEMIHQGVILANQMLDRACFKQWVLAAKYTENNDMTQPQIYGLVTTQPSRVDVEMYTGDWWANHKWRTVGYENDPFDGVVHMNRYFVRTATDVADNLIHEDRGHSLGFHHYGAHATSEPYGMNYAYEGCANQMMQRRGGKAYRPPGLRLEVHKGGRRFLHDFGKRRHAGKGPAPHHARAAE